MTTTTVIAAGAALCVPVIVVLTLEVETRVHYWAARVSRRFTRRVCEQPWQWRCKS